MTGRVWRSVMINGFVIDLFYGNGRPVRLPTVAELSESDRKKYRRALRALRARVRAAERARHLGGTCGINCAACWRSRWAAQASIVFALVGVLGCGGGGSVSPDASRPLRLGGDGIVSLHDRDASGDGAAAALDASTDPDASARDASGGDGAAAALDASTDPDASAPDSCSTREREQCEAAQCVSVCHNCVGATGATSSVPLCCDSSACALFRSPGCDCDG